MAKQSGKATELIQLRGAPRQVLLQSHLPALTQAEFLPDATLAKIIGTHKHSLRIRKHNDGTIKQVKIRLPEATPPGRYAGTLKSGQQEFPIAIDVQEKQRLQIAPASLQLHGKPGEKIYAQLLLINKGNVSINIPERDVVGIYDDDGMEVAFAATYRLETDDPLVLLKNFVGKLREGHGGLLKIRVSEGAGELPPATQKSITLEINFSEAAKANHQYHGVWSLGPVEYALTLAVSKVTP
jgi:hypothetical protein